MHVPVFFPAFAQPPAGPDNEMDVVEKHCLNVQIPPYSCTMWCQIMRTRLRDYLVEIAHV